jgi:hypothetical protein
MVVAAEPPEPDEEPAGTPDGSDDEPDEVLREGC